MNQALVIGIITGAIYGILALGLVLLYKSNGIFNFAQGEFGTVSIYALFVCTQIFHFPYAVAALLALATAILMGVLTERLIVQPLFEAARVTLLVATAGVALLAVGLEFWIGKPELRNVAPALPKGDRVKVLSVFVSDQRLLTLFVLVVLAVALAVFFSRSSLGLAILAASQEPTATNLMGISVKRLSTLTWGLAGLLGGTAGLLYAPIEQLRPALITSSLLIPAFTAAVIGGMNSLPGAFVGGIIVGVAQAMASAPQFKFLNENVPGSGSVVVFALLLIVLTIRPQGLFGRT